MSRDNARSETRHFRADRMNASGCTHAAYLPFNRESLAGQFVPSPDGKQPDDRGGTWLLIQDNSLLVQQDSEGSEWRLPQGPLSGALERMLSPIVYLGMYCTSPCWAAGVPSGIQIPGESGKRCPQCAYEHYPHLHPAVIILVRDGDRVLLTRKSFWPKGRYGLIAGFVDVGESLEGAAEREVREEVGVEIRDFRYAGSQYWPFPSQLMIVVMTIPGHHEP